MNYYIGNLYGNKIPFFFIIKVIKNRNNMYLYYFFTPNYIKQYCQIKIKTLNKRKKICFSFNNNNHTFLCRLEKLVEMVEMVKIMWFYHRRITPHITKVDTRTRRRRNSRSHTL